MIVSIGLPLGRGVGLGIDLGLDTFCIRKKDSFLIKGPRLRLGLDYFVTKKRERLSPRPGLVTKKESFFSINKES